MTVLPGSLDYLYYNGIIDHIPYEAYDMGYYPVAVNNVSNPYNYENYEDTFTKSEQKPVKDEKSFRESLTAGFDKKKGNIPTTPTVIKGLLGGLVMLGTLFLLIRGKKKP